MLSLEGLGKLIQVRLFLPPKTEALSIENHFPNMLKRRLEIRLLELFVEVSAKENFNGRS